ncbi:hypothetical protein NC652_029312, partial [Populus alba x Populus x berolinensis]
IFFWRGPENALQLRAGANGSAKGPISDRPLETILKEFKQLKEEYPDRILIASIMEEYEKAAWEELTDPVEQTGIVRFRHHQYSLSGIGGFETGGDAAEFILPGANTVQVCTGVMMHGYGLVKKLREELKDFMKMHNFSSVEDFRG